MSLLSRWLWLLAALLVLGWWLHAPSPRARDPGVLVADAPLQQPLDLTPPALEKPGVAIKPLATFSLSARVLGRADYRWDFGAALIPVDLALGWGRMSDTAVLDQMDISQGSRFYHWQVKQFPIPEREIIESSANMHLIPATDAVEREIKRTSVGDVVTFNGYLVEADWPDGTKWVSSMTRSDSGAGACELVWVEHFDIAPH
ncbi:MAG TPA: hypothetical protein VIE67_10360 [Rudaea sp.]|uniref:hypothetical protein n=1 Tax=Rudaea sp. TaxID=2136325 RepID=UPI002F922979